MPCPYRILSGLGAAVRAIAGTTKPGAVIEHHRLVADRAVRRFFSRQGTQGVEVQLIIGFVSHECSYRSGGLTPSAFSALSREGTPMNFSLPSMIVAGVARIACRSTSSCPSGLRMSTSL